ncbi:MAG: ATP-binding protein [Chloroflexota bacterium]|nr:ATP-binding protein [Chloroflexota bacterium]
MRSHGIRSNVNRPGNGNQFKVLLVDDDPNESRNVRKVLAGSTEASFEVKGAKSLSAAVKNLKTQSYDAVLLDLSLPDSQGVGAVTAISGANAMVPIVVLADSDDGEIGIQALKEGAEDYILRDLDVDRGVARSICNSIERKKSRTPSRYEDPIQRQKIDDDQQQLISALEEHSQILTQAHIELDQALEEVKRSEQALRESEEKYSTLVELSPDSIIVLCDGYITFANQGVLEVFGLERSELIGQSLIKLLNGRLSGMFSLISAEELKMIQRRLADSAKGEIGSNSYEIPIKNGVGDHIWIDARTTPIKYSGKNAELILARNVTQRKQADEERERLRAEIVEKNTELEQIIFVTSHDLRSPLINVQGFAKELGYSIQELSSILEDDSELYQKVVPLLEEDIAGALEYINASVTKMDTLLAGLLRLSRAGRAALNFEELDMKYMISEIEKNFEFRIRDVGMATKVDELPSCKGDAVQINQVFSNLVDNALKYRDQGRSPRVTVTGKVDRNYSIYCVEDNGLGIPKEEQDRVFEIFHQVNPGGGTGEGLGLAVVKRILSRHEGRIWLESEPGVGSKFFVALPRN